LCWHWTRRSARWRWSRARCSGTSRTWSILARAFAWEDAHALLEAGVHHVYRESVDTSARLGVDALRLMGFHGHEAHRAAQRFLRHEERTLRAHRCATATRTATSMPRGAPSPDLERVLEADRSAPDPAADGGWDPESLRSEVRGRVS
jgi:monovalent cation:H+ antiporter-2, CPA2 family